MNFCSPLRPLLKGWLLSFLVFGLLAFILVGQFALAVSMPLDSALRTAARDWLPWALLTPLIFRLVSRLPLERRRWRIAWPVHIIVGLATIAACSWWAENVFPPRFGPGSWRSEIRAPGGPPPGPRDGRLPRPWPEGRSPGRPEPRRNPFNAFFLIGFRAPIYLAIVSVAHALLFYRRSQEHDRLEASLAKARVEALKMQLQPHFLFNSLNAIAALVHTNPEGADEMLAALSELLRLTLETSGAQELPLHQELQFVERYLAIEHVRFGDRLRFHLDVPPNTHAAMVPTFLLQPLVENAVRHGLEPQSGAGLLTVRARREDRMLHISIADNGVGLGNGTAKHEGIGLTNTRARLRALYRDQASLELRNADGLSVDIILPFRTEE